jgi:tetratricopeptide (TPR) repeat protein
MTPQDAIIKRPSQQISTAALLIATLCTMFALVSCHSETLERQAQQLREQEMEIARQNKEIEALRANQQRDDEKQKNCARAFREYFDKAQFSKSREESIALYRQGLKICPDDEVAHYELGRTLVDAGRAAEAAASFEAALKINPAFADAQRQLDAIQRKR